MADSTPQWREIRHLRSILGDHLLVRDEQGWKHLDAQTLEPWPLPNGNELTSLLTDAFRFNPERYGSVVDVSGSQATTDTGVNLVIDWPSLTISQNGRDSRWIDRVYSIHYLEWTGFYWSDRVLGVGGLLLLLYMTFTGYRMAFLPAQRRAKEDDPAR